MLERVEDDKRREASGRAGTGSAREVSKGVPKFYNTLFT